MNYRLAALFYLLALVASSLAVFGPLGLGVAVLVLSVYYVILLRKLQSCLGVFVVAIVVLSLPTLWHEASSNERNVVHQQICANRLRCLAMATLAYESVKEQLPVAGVGKRRIPVPSWRVEILPEVDEQEYYDEYDFSEPWDGPSNKKLVTPTRIEMFWCPLHSEEINTNYFAITGPETAWGDGEPRSLADISDGTENTILLIEAAGRGVHWAEPKDLTFAEAVELLTTPLKADSHDAHLQNYGYFYKPGYVRNVVLCDGSCQSLPVPITREAAVALLTANGGEHLDMDTIYSGQFGPELDYGRVWGATLFAVIALLPAIPAVKRRIWPGSPNQTGPVPVEHEMPVE